MWIETTNSNRIASLDATKTKALKQAETLELPKRGEEYWKYTDIKGFLDKEQFSLETPDPVDAKAAKGWNNEDTVKVVFVNGMFQSALSDPLPDGVEIAGDAYESVEKTAAVDKLTALNDALSTGGSHIIVSGVVSKPIEWIYLYDSNKKHYLNIKNSVILKPNASVTIHERWMVQKGSEGFGFVQNTAQVASNAHLKWYKYQVSPSFSGIDQTVIDQDSDSVASVFTLSLDGKLLRNNLVFRQHGKNSESIMKAVTIPGEGQHFDHATNVIHSDEYGFSNQSYKQIVGENGKGIFNGRILVEAKAQKTNAFQQNDSIILTDQGGVKTKPQLEIFADDVKCSHGCTIGQLDDSALFYMRQRGISKAAAQVMLLKTFLWDALGDFDEYSQGIVEQKLNNGI